MNEERMNTEPEKDNEKTAPVTDTSDIIRRHMKDPEDEITDEDILRIKPGGDEEKIKQDAEAYLAASGKDGDDDGDYEEEEDDDNDDDKDEPSADNPVTPWNVLKD